MSRSYERHPLPALLVDFDALEYEKAVPRRLKASTLLIAILGFIKMKIDFAYLLLKETTPREQVRSCWQEFIQNSTAYSSVWFNVFDQFERKSALFKGALSKGSLPRLNNLDSNGTGMMGETWNSLIDHFKANRTKLRTLLDELMEELGKHKEHITFQSDGKITARSFPEIVLEAILLTQRDYRGVVSRENALRYPTTASTRSFGLSGWNDDISKKNDPKRQGTLACVAAMLFKKEIFTGSTKPYLGNTLGKHQLVGGAIVEDYMIWLRRSRYDNLDAQRIDELIAPQISFFESVRKRFQNPPHSHSPPEAMELALKEVYRTASQRLPDALVSFFQDDKNSLCLAYEGDGSFKVKDKCCICDCVYKVKVVMREKTEPNFKSAGETSKTQDESGVCAEALAFVQLAREAIPQWFFP